MNVPVDEWIEKEEWMERMNLEAAKMPGNAEISELQIY